jgi:predicted nucleic acid-binding protein
VAERRESGVLDTCVFIDYELLDPAVLPEEPEITAITMAELHQGVVRARSDESRAVRTERLGAALVAFEPLPFDGEAAARYGTFVAMTLAVKRDPRPRALDLMIAAIASCHGLPLFTRNIKDFVGLGDLVEVVGV